MAVIVSVNAVPTVAKASGRLLTVGTGTAAIASTVGARTLGLPVIVGLNASNTAYVLQGALLVASRRVRETPDSRCVCHTISPS